jgi:hypothetical protein
MRKGYQKAPAGVRALAVLILFAALFASPGYADDPSIKLSGGTTPTCDLAKIFPPWAICYVLTSTCLAHGGHVGYQASDTSGAPHCLHSDLVPSTK